MTRKYEVIYADPPWKVRQFPGDMRKRYGDKIPEIPYDSMSLEDIAALPVASLAANDCALFMWTTNRYLEDSFGIARAWGFTPVTTLVWAKAPMGRGLGGGVFGITAEFLLYAKIGKPVTLGRYPSTWFDGKRGPHSRKPLIAREIIDRHFPGRRIELFAREAFLGWECLGKRSHL